MLTTQSYCPGAPRNGTDALFDPALPMDVRGAGNGREATFDSVLDANGTPGPGDPGTPPTEPPGGTRAPNVPAPWRRE
ncbi:hypothetical protein ACFYNZ_06805 [Streptomyces kebangsaanensis]|uniref:Uncharacterized protein n=1 Tax=Streptomyces kebangsaanensis TaxID=864058 RepID=A0ABW6KRX1_9ACTN